MPFGALYVFLSDIPPIDDSDLLIDYVAIAAEANRFHRLQQAITTIDLTEDERYEISGEILGNATWTAEQESQVADLLRRNRDAGRRSWGVFWLFPGSAAGFEMQDTLAVLVEYILIIANVANSSSGGSSAVSKQQFMNRLIIGVCNACVHRSGAARNIPPQPWITIRFRFTLDRLVAGVSAFPPCSRWHLRHSNA